MSDPERSGGGGTGAVAVAAAVSLAWLAGAGVLLAVLGPDSALWLAVAVAVALPLVGIWFAALLARQSAMLRDEARHLAEAAVARSAGAARTLVVPAPEPGPAAPPVRPAAAPPATPPATTEVRQQSLPFPVEPETVRLPLAELARALDFPDSAEDEAGFRALRLALADARAKRLVQASQDVLTLLGEDGIYMDDLEPDRARPELWRRFAAGERGPAVGRVGGIRDRSSLALSAARMRADPVFRDATHHFLRLFDRTLAEVAPDATDADLEALTETRTARAFMLLGRAAGIFA